MILKDFFRAFRLKLRFRRRAFARLGSAILAFALLATIPNALLSCKAKNTPDNSGLQAAAEAKAQSTVSQPVVSTPSTGSGTATTATHDPSKIDLDLTKMSATMIYSTIFDMLIMPEDYIDKNIKVQGWFETYTDPETAELYYAVVVPDATACCQQGLEFVWLGDHTYPADFPDTGADITVTGRYKLIENDGITYNYLEASKVEF